jgi:hypothetical protein
LLNLHALHEIYNMFKYLILVLVTALVLTISPASAQDTPDSRLLSKFSKKELKALDASTLNYWTFYLENSFEITGLPKGKGGDAVEQTITLENMDKEEINVFKLGFEPHEHARDYFRIEGTNKMIIVLPHTEIDKKFKRQ